MSRELSFCEEEEYYEDMYNHYDDEDDVESESEYLRNIGFDAERLNNEWRK